MPFMISIYLLPDLHTFQSSTHFALIFPSHIIFAPFFLSLFRCTHYLHPLFCSISSFILQKKEYDWGRLSSIKVDKLKITKGFQLSTYIDRHLILNLRFAYFEDL